MQEFFNQFFTQYEASQDFLSVLNGKKTFSEYYLIAQISLIVFLSIFALVKPSLNKIIILAVITFTATPVIHFAFKEVYPNDDNKHYVIIPKTYLSDYFDKHQDLSKEDKEAILIAFKNTQEEDFHNQEPIYDFETLKAFALMDSQTIINLSKYEETLQSKLKDKKNKKNIFIFHR